MKFFSHSNTRLVSFIKEVTNTALSLRAIKRALEKGICKVNGKRELFASRNLTKGDEVELFDGWDHLGSETKRAEIENLYEDDYFLIVDKPSGVVCEDRNFPYPLVHRLDKETSGVLILAKISEAKEAMKKLFLEKRVKKSYIALVDGIVQKESGMIESFLVKKKLLNGQSIWGSSKHGLYAKTLWQVLKRESHHTLLYIEIPTGRTHQIRVHLAEMKHPLLGDCQYGKGQNKRIMLHSLSISFEHPFLKKEILVFANRIQNWL